MKSTLCLIAGFGVLAFVMGGCNTAPKSAEAKADLHDDATAALNKFKRADSDLEALLNKSQGYAIFPTIGKGGVLVGGAYGKGELFEKNQMIGYCDVTQASIGLQLGGQKFSELIVFDSKAALDNFKSGNFAFSAQASAVAATAGASKAAKFEGGVAVFTLGEAGLMYEASVGGQKFDYRPK